MIKEKKLTESPVRHRRRSANKRRVLIDDGERRGAGEEVKVQNTPDNLIREGIAPVENIHTVAVQQQDRVSARFPTGIPEVHVHRVRPVQIRIQVNRRNIGGVQSVGIVGVELDAVGLRVLPQTVQRGVFRQFCRDLQVLVFEHQIAVRIRRLRAAVEENLAVGFPFHRETERILRVGEDELRPDVLRERVLRRRGERLLQLRRLLPRQEIVRNLPSLLLRGGDVDSQTAAGFVPAGNIVN